EPGRQHGHGWQDRGEHGDGREYRAGGGRGHELEHRGWDDHHQRYRVERGDHRFSDREWDVDGREPGRQHGHGWQDRGEHGDGREYRHGGERGHELEHRGWDDHHQRYRVERGDHRFSDREWDVDGGEPGRQHGHGRQDRGQHGHG